MFHSCDITITPPDCKMNCWRILLSWLTEANPICGRIGGAVWTHKVQYEPLSDVKNLLPLLGQESAMLGLARQLQALRQCTFDLVAEHNRASPRLASRSHRLPLFAKGIPPQLHRCCITFQSTGRTLYMQDLLLGVACARHSKESIALYACVRFRHCIAGISQQVMSVFMRHRYAGARLCGFVVLLHSQAWLNACQYT